MPYYFTISADGAELETLCIGYDAFELFDALLSIKPVWDRESQPTFPDHPPVGVSKEQTKQFRIAENAARGVTTISFDQLGKSRSGTIGSLLWGFIEKATASLRKPKSHDLTPDENVEVSKADLELASKVRPRMTPRQIAAIRQYDREVESVVRESSSPFPGRVPHYKYEAFDGWHISSAESQIIADELKCLLDLADEVLIAKLAATESAQRLFPNWEIGNVEAPTEPPNGKDLGAIGSTGDSVLKTVPQSPTLEPSDIVWIRDDGQKWRDFHSRAAGHSGYSVS